MFNNRKYLEKALSSLEGLKPYKLYVTDNFSTDGGYEYLKTKKNIFIVRKRCTRGEGREIALKQLVKEGNSKDLVFIADFDSYFKPAFYKIIVWAKGNLKNDEIIAFAGICRLHTAKKLRWVDLNYGEDDEFIAHAYSVLKGRKIYLADSNLIRINAGLKKDSIENIRKYANRFSFLKRGLQAAIESHQGIAYKNYFGEAKTPTLKFANAIGHIIAKLKGVYSYDKFLANNVYIRKTSTHVFVIKNGKIRLKSIVKC